MLGTYNTRHEAGPGGARFRACLAVALLLLINGCASVKTTRNPAESPHPSPSVLIVAPARFEPAAKVAPILRTKGEAAAEGAGGGALGAVGGTLEAMITSGPFAVLLLPVFVPIGAIYGAVTESSVAASEETLAKGRQPLERVISQLRLQQRIQHSVVAELQAAAVGKWITVNGDIGPVTPDEHPSYLQVDAPMVLELSVRELGFSRGKTELGKDGYALTLTTQARLLDTANHTVLDEMKHTHRGEAHTATEWLQDNAGSFERAVDVAIESSAHNIVLEFFLLYYPPMAAESDEPDRPIVPYYALRPIYPEPRRGIDLRGILSDKYVTGQLAMQFTLVDDLQPTFRWEAFPRPIDLAGREGEKERFTDVRYELAIFQAVMKRDEYGGHKYYSAGPLLYTRTGLPEPKHHMEEPLQPCNRYAWTVRARFKLDGQPRVTEWTGFYGLGALSPPPWHYRRSIPPFDTRSFDSSELYLLFRTPPPQGSTECAN